jgi:hypothetical protein
MNLCIGGSLSTSLCIGGGLTALAAGRTTSYGDPGRRGHQGGVRRENRRNPRRR